MGGLGRKFLHKLPDLEILRNLEAPFILWIHIDIYFLASTSYTERRAVLVVSRDGYMLWAWSSKAAYRTVKGGEKPDQRAEQNTASAAVGVRWSEGVRIRLGAAVPGNAGRA